MYMYVTTVVWESGFTLTSIRTVDTHLNSKAVLCEVPHVCVEEYTKRFVHSESPSVYHSSFPFCMVSYRVCMSRARGTG